MPSDQSPDSQNSLQSRFEIRSTWKFKHVKNRKTRNPVFGSVFTPPIEVKFRDQEPSFPSFVHIGWRQVKRERGARRSGGGDLAAGGKFNSVAMVDISILETRLWLACDLLVTRHKQITSKSQANHKQITSKSQLTCDASIRLWRVREKKDLYVPTYIRMSLPSDLAAKEPMSPLLRVSKYLRKWVQ